MKGNDKARQRLKGSLDNSFQGEIVAKEYTHLYTVPNLLLTQGL